MTPRPTILGVAGPSGSGKSTLARKLQEALHADLLPLDAYYRPLDHLSEAERAHRNFDHPDSFEVELLAQHLRTLTHGGAIERPCYDFTQHTRRAGETVHVAPRAFLIVEGILALHYPELRSFFDLGIYVEAPGAVCLDRRIHRDTRERGRTEEAVRQQFRLTAQPMADQFVLPSARHADLVVSGTGDVHASLEQVLALLRARHLLG